MPTAQPKISVIVASVVGAPFIDDCIESLTKQKDAPGFEVVVVDCHGQETRDRLAAKFPEIRIIVQASRETIPELRRIGVSHSKGQIIAILEEHCLASEDWLARIDQAFEGPYAAVGGCVADLDYGRLRDWVTYFGEYNAFMPPIPAGKIAYLPGCNMAFRRDVLERHLAVLHHGYWEAFLFSRLQEENAALLSDPDLVVYHRGPFDYLYYLRQRYLFSRAFAGARREVMPKRQRLIYVLSSPVLPALLLARIGARVVNKRRRIQKFVRCLPMLVPYSFVYIFGEVVGYIAGPGDSLMKVE